MTCIHIFHLVCIKYLMSLDMTMANGCDTKNHHHSILFINVSNPLNYKVISSNKILCKIMYKYTNYCKMQFKFWLETFQEQLNNKLKNRKYQINLQQDSLKYIDMTLTKTVTCSSLVYPSRAHLHLSMWHWREDSTTLWWGLIGHVTRASLLLGKREGEKNKLMIDWKSMVMIWIENKKGIISRFKLHLN